MLLRLYKNDFPLWEFFKDISGYSDVLQETLVPLIPEEKCRSPEIYGTELTENMFCAGYFDSKSDACQVMLGVLSRQVVEMYFGQKCCSATILTFDFTVFLKKRNVPKENNLM